MSIGKILTRVADAKLAAHGFEKSKIKGHGVWVYERRKDDIVYILMFQKSNYFAGIDLRFYNSASLTAYFHPDELSPYLSDLIKRNESGFITYQDEKELESIIIALTDAAIEKVIPLFDVIMRPDQRPTIEMYKALSENTKEYANAFVREYHVAFETEPYKIKERIKDIERLIDENRNKTLDELSELFLTAAAYLGEMIIRTHKGVWGWKNDNFYIMDINDNERENGRGILPIRRSPLVDVFRYWDKPEFYNHSISHSYKGLLNILGINDSKIL